MLAAAPNLQLVPSLPRYQNHPGYKVLSNSIQELQNVLA